MLRSALVSCAALAALAFATMNEAPAEPSNGGGIFHDLSAHPVLVYSLRGGTLTGTLHSQLTVYDNGFVTIGEQNDVVFPNPGVFEDVRTGNIDGAAVKALRRKLAAAGAFALGDQPFAVSDVPLNTVTVFTTGPGAGDQMAHTFSYWLSIDEYEDVATAIGEVLAQIPGGGGGGSSSF